MPSYPDQIKIKRLVRTDLGHGSFKEEFTVHSMPKARVQPISQAENIRAGRKTSNRGFNVYLPITIDVTMKDVIEWEDETYEIVELEKYPNVYRKLVVVLQ